MHLSKQAKNAFLSGNYQLAMELYSQAIVEQPELSHLYVISLNISRKKLGLPPTNLTSLLQTLPNMSTTSLCTKDIESKFEKAFSEASASAHHIIATPTARQPLVSVLMATHNCSDLVEQSITSLLRQTWHNIEIIVVDLASSDSTWVILQRLRRTVHNIKCYRLNSSQGFPYGLNHAVSKAAGDYIFFQSSHDFSHPDRIQLSMLKLMRPDVAAVSGSAFELNSTTTSTNEALRSNVYGIMTLGLRRSVFAETGSLSLTALSDEEYLQRLFTWSDHNKLMIASDTLPLYYRTHPPHHDQHSTQASIENHKSNIKTYRYSFQKAHIEIDPERFKDVFRFPSSTHSIDTPIALSQRFEPTLPIIANICSIPERANLLKQTLESLSPQVHQINIYLDRYKQIPDFINKCHPNVRIYSSTEHPDLRDNGKFLMFTDSIEECYYFTVDDDLVYPPDYIESLVRCIEKYSRKAVIGLHGVLLPEHPAGYFSSYRKVHSFEKELERDALVNVLGTGTVAFHSHLMQGLTVNYFKKSGMADLYLAIYCKDNLIPMVALARPDEWLTELPSPNTSLYHEFKLKDDEQSHLVGGRCPWGYTSIKQAVAHVSCQDRTGTVSAALEKMIPPMWECLKS